MSLTQKPLYNIVNNAVQEKTITNPSLVSCKQRYINDQIACDAKVFSEFSIFLLQNSEYKKRSHSTYVLAAKASKRGMLF